ncbi:MAG: FmdB family zinc ribbon protein [Gemmatimonadaceae bacterium]
MPTYGFRCPEGHEFDHFYRSMSGSKMELPCPTCGKMAQRLVSGGAGLVFKGSGFYITDYGKDGKKDQRAASKSESGKSEGSTSESSDSSKDSAKDSSKDSSKESSASASSSDKPAEKPKKESTPAPPPSSGSE